MNKKEIKKGRHSRMLLPGISLLYVVNQIGKIPHLINNRSAGAPRQKHSGMTAYFMKSHAFTLIELLVVVLIIGILAAIALPQYQAAVEKSRATQLYVQLSSLAEAQQVYYLANGEYAGDFTALDVDLPCDSTTGDMAVFEENNFVCGNYTFHKCGGFSCVYAFKNYKDGVYALQADFTNKSFVCMATKNTKAENLCKSLGFTEWYAYGAIGIGNMNYYKQP